MISAGVAVVWNDSFGVASGWEIEFHLSPNKAEEIHTSHVTSVLFRIESFAELERLFVQISDGIEALDEALLHLPHLEKVVLENPDSDDSDDGAAFASGMAHMTDMIHRQTCKQSQELALNKKLSAEHDDQVVVSPRWYPENHLQVGYTDGFWWVEISQISLRMCTTC